MSPRKGSSPGSTKRSLHGGWIAAVPGMVQPMSQMLKEAKDWV